MFKYPRLSSLTCLAFQVNSAIDEKRDEEFSFQEIYQDLETGSLLQDLSNKVPEVFDLGLILMDENQHRGLIHVLKIASEAFEGREGHLFITPFVHPEPLGTPDHAYRRENRIAHRCPHYPGLLSEANDIGHFYRVERVTLSKSYNRKDGPCPCAVIKFLVEIG